MICGISGQDGAYLAQLLLNHGYEVYGTSRDAQISTLANLQYLGLAEKETKWKVLCKEKEDNTLTV